MTTFAIRATVLGVLLGSSTVLSANVSQQQLPQSVLMQQHKLASIVKNQSLIDKLKDLLKFDYAVVLQLMGYTPAQLDTVLLERYPKDFELHQYFSNYQGPLKFWDYGKFIGYLLRLTEVVGYPGEVCDSNKAIGEIISNTTQIYVQPFASSCEYGTFERPYSVVNLAKNAVKTVKNQGATNIEVLIGAGDYYFEKSLTFEQADSGTLEAPIVYRAITPNSVRLLGSTSLNLNQFTQADETFTAKLVEQNAAAHIVAINLNELGVTELDELTSRGVGLDTQQPSANLYFGEQQMTLARWPNSDDASPYLSAQGNVLAGLGQVSFAAVLDEGISAENVAITSPEFQNGGGTVTLAFDRPKHWQSISDVFVDGVLGKPWHWTYNQINSFDAQTGSLSLKRGELAGISAENGGHFYFSNVAEELDSPGEYYIDRQTNTLYLYPLGSQDTELELSLLKQPLITLNNAEHITFSGLELSGGQALAVTANASNGITFEHCKVNNFTLGGFAIDGQNNRVTHCQINNLGGTGIVLSGGVQAEYVSATSLKTPVEKTPANNTATYNTLFDIGLQQKVLSPAIALEGVGNSAKYNHIYNVSHSGIAVEKATDSHVSQNFIHDLPTFTTAKSAAVYVNTGSKINFTGNQISANLIADTKGSGILLDDYSAGTTVSSNILNRVNGTGILVNGGANAVKQNLIYQTATPIAFSDDAEVSTFALLYPEYLAQQGAFNAIGLENTGYVNDAQLSKVLAYDTQVAFQKQVANVKENLSIVAENLADSRVGTTGVLSPEDKRWQETQNAYIFEINNDISADFAPLAAILDISADIDWQTELANATSQIASSLAAILPKVVITEPSTPNSSFADTSSWQNDDAKNYWTANSIDGVALDIMRLTQSDNLGGNNANNQEVTDWLASSANVANNDGHIWRFASYDEMRAINGFFANDNSAFEAFNGGWSPKGGQWSALIPTEQQGECTHVDGCAFPAFSFTVKTTTFSNVSYKQSAGFANAGAAPLIVRVASESSDVSSQNLVLNGDFENGSTEPWNIAQGGAVIGLVTEQGNTVAEISNRQASHASTVKQSFAGLEAEVTYQFSVDVKIAETGFDVAAFIGYRENGATKDTSIQLNSYVRSEGQWLTLSGTFSLPATADVSKDARIWLRTNKGANATSSNEPNILFDNVIVSKQNSTDNPDGGNGGSEQPSGGIADATSYYNEASNSQFWTGYQLAGKQLDVMRLPFANSLPTGDGSSDANNVAINDWLTANPYWRFASKSELEAVRSFFNNQTTDFINFNSGIWGNDNGQNSWHVIAENSSDNNATRFSVNSESGFSPNNNALSESISTWDFSAAATAPLLVRELNNLATNGDLSSGDSTGFSAKNATLSVESDGNGGFYMLVSGRSGKTHGARYNANFSAGKTYRISVDAKLANGQAAEPLELFTQFKAGGKTVKTVLDTAVSQDTWVRLSGEISIDANAGTVSNGFIIVQSNDYADISFDNLRILEEVLVTNPDNGNGNGGNDSPLPDGAEEGYGYAQNQCVAEDVALNAVFVAPNGTDQAGSGSENAPYASLAYALQQITDQAGNAAGQTVYLRQGSYSESVSSQTLAALKGSQQQPVVIRNYPCEQVRLTGLKTVTDIAFKDELGNKASWQVFYGDIYRITLDRPVWQLFDNEEQQMLARWPNANFDLPSSSNTQSIYSHDVWAEGVIDSAKNQNGIMTNDASYHDLAAALDYSGQPLDVSGAIVVANTASFYTYSRLVKAYDAMSAGMQGKFKTLPSDTSVAHTPGSAVFTHEPVPNSYKGKQLSYYLEASLALLDSPGEWHYQLENGEHALYYWPINGGVPSDTITARDTGYALDVANWQHVEVSGIEFIAAALKCAPCNDIRITNNRFKYAAASRRVLKQWGGDKPGYGQNQLIELLSATDTASRANSGIVFENNEVTDTDVQTLIVEGGNSAIRNNLFERLDYTGADTQGPHATVMITRMSGEKAEFSYNTMDVIGNSTMFVPEGGSLHALYNNMITGGFAQNDGASFQLRKEQQAAVNIAYNWAHDSEKYGIRFDAPFVTTNETTEGQFGLIHHNVVFNAKGIMVKGNDHRVFHNTLWNNADVDLRILVDTGLVNDYLYKNDRSEVVNNASDSISSDRAVLQDYPSSNRANYSADEVAANSPVSMLNDPFNYDFRPKAGGLLHDSGELVNATNSYPNYVGAAPLPQYQESTVVGSNLDLGAYEVGSSYYWIPGYRKTQASFPIPRNELTDASAKPVSSAASLIWRDSYLGVKHHLYLGNSKASVEAAIGTNDPLYIGVYVADEANIYTPNQGFTSGNHYWRVDVELANGEVIKGDTWKFIVE